MKTEIITLTPERASNLLDRNERNRRVSVAHVKELARQMKAGLWREDGAAIRMDREGRLIDGQHRCYAVVESGVSLENVIFVSDLDPAVMATIDTGKKRSSADVLSMYDPELVDTGSLAALTAAIIRWEAGAGRNTLATSPEGRLKFPADHQAVLAYFIDNRSHLIWTAREAKRVSRRVKIPLAVLGVGIHLFYAIDATDAADFFEKLSVGADLPFGSPILALRRRAESSQQRSSDKVNSATWLGMLIKGWNKYRAGEEWRLAAYRSGGSAAEPFPTPN